LTDIRNQEPALQTFLGGPIAKHGAEFKDSCYPSKNLLRFMEIRMTKATLAHDPVIVSHKRILGGRPIFRGTRVQAEILFENLADGYSIDDVLEEFPTLDREDIRKALLQACEALKQSAPDVTQAREPSLARARVL